MLRGIAVLAVVLFHISPTYFNNGYLGVNSFFVISGFVILPSILKITKGQNFKDKMSLLKLFYIKRFFRLVPTLSVTIVSSTLLIICLCPTWIFERLVKQGIASILLLGNIGAYRYSGGDYFDINPNPLIHLWSLSTEEQIYIFIPMLFLIFSNLYRSRIALSPRLILLVLLIFGYTSQYYFFPKILGNFGIRNPDGLVFYLPTSHIWEFAVGGLVSLMGIKASSFFKKRSMQIFGIICSILLVSVMFSSLNLNSKPLLVTLLTSFVIASRAINFYSQKVNNIFLWIGNRSYSIYLCHMPIIYIFHYSPYINNLNKLISIFLIALSISLTSRFLYNKFEVKYRIRFDQNKSSLTLPFKNIIIFTVLPLIFLFIALYWVTQVTWVYNKTARPVYAAGTDTKCDRLASGQPCWYPTGGSREISLLIGDSVSAAYIDTFISKSHSDRKTAVTMTLAGCQFVTRNSAQNSKYSVLAQNFNQKWGLNKQTCFDHNEKIVQFIKQYKPKKVFLSQHTVNNGYSTLGVSKLDLRELRITNIRTLNDLAEELLVIGAPPLSKSGQVMATQTLFKIFGDTSDIRFSNLDPDFIHDDKYMSLKLAKYGISYSSLMPLFCDTRDCKVFENGWLYFDLSHISTLGAKRLFYLF